MGCFAVRTRGVFAASLQHQHSSAEFTTAILKDTHLQRKREKERESVRVYVSDTKQISLWTHIISRALPLYGLQLYGSAPRDNHIPNYSNQLCRWEMGFAKVVSVARWFLGGRGVRVRSWERPGGFLLWRETAEAYSGLFRHSAEWQLKAKRKHSAKDTENRRVRAVHMGSMNKQLNL